MGIIIPNDGNQRYKKPPRPKAYCREPGGFIRNNTSGLTLNQSGAKAPGANVQFLRRTVYHSTNMLNVGLPSTLGFDLGVADIIAVSSLLAADLTFKSHRDTPPC
jgi:hypothetical protein